MLQTEGGKFMREKRGLSNETWVTQFDNGGQDTGKHR